MKLTLEQIEKYIDDGGVRCPYCGSENITGSYPETDVGESWQDVECDDCGKEWTDLYRLVGVDVDEDDED